MSLTVTAFIAILHDILPSDRYPSIPHRSLPIKHTNHISDTIFDILKAWAGPTDKISHLEGRAKEIAGYIRNELEVGGKEYVVGMGKVIEVLKWLRDDIAEMLEEEGDDGVEMETERRKVRILELILGELRGV